MANHKSWSFIIQHIFSPFENANKQYIVFRLRSHWFTSLTLLIIKSHLVLHVSLFSPSPPLKWTSTHPIYPQVHSRHKCFMFTAESWNDVKEKKTRFEISWGCRNEIFVNNAFCWSTLHKYVLKAQRTLGGFGKSLDCLDKWHFIASRCL